MADQQAPPRFIGCEMGDGNTADIVLVNLYIGDSHIVCMLHFLELADAAGKALFTPDDPEVMHALEDAGDLTQAEVTGSFDVPTFSSSPLVSDEDSFDDEELDLS